MSHKATRYLTLATYAVVMNPIRTLIFLCNIQFTTYEATMVARFDSLIFVCIHTEIDLSLLLLYTVKLGNFVLKAAYLHLQARTVGICLMQLYTHGSL